MPLATSRASYSVADTDSAADTVHPARRGEPDRLGRAARTDLARLSAPFQLHPPRSTVPLDALASEVLRIVSDSRTPVFVTVHEGGRTRYGYWRPVDSATGRGGCYVALPTDVCDKLRSGGRIELGEPVTDPSKTTYRIRPARARAKTGRPEGSAA
ncbi:hypothetical protein ACFQ6E_14645 [Streptomyces sp. NPDC056462]|uniref:hypothetical protein n=1 Tax=Streptomyces sp. NPDC056462 TaxID=3345826 RepID=UPI0036B636C2